MDKRKATLIGLIAIILWSSIVGLIRSVSESFGAIGGAAMIYSIAAIILILTVGFPKLSQFPKLYLIWGTLLFVSYEICLALSIGFANTPRQAIEVGMVNYLWPSFTIIGAILFNRQKSTMWIIPGIVLSFIGIVWLLGGNDGININNIINNVKDNPFSYGMAFLGAIIWAAYCVVTAKFAKGSNGITLYFILVAILLWLQYILMGTGSFDITLSSIFVLLLASSAMGFGYAAWNIGILHGNVSVLATMSYFTPVFSAFLAALVLSTPLSLQFWQGVMMVCIGSIICWLSTYQRIVKK